MELDSTMTNRLEAALAADKPRARLQKLMNELLEEGCERDDLLPALGEYQARLAESGRADAADLIAEIMDGFTSWCNFG